MRTLSSQSHIKNFAQFESNVVLTRVANQSYNRRRQNKVFLSFLSFSIGGRVRESTYQSYLIGQLRDIFPGCVVLKNDSDYLQGIPDLLVLWHTRWAMLEVKPRRNAPEQPNQSYYVDLLDGMSFAAFIYPENEEEVLRELQQTFRSRRATRIS